MLTGDPWFLCAQANEWNDEFGALTDMRTDKWTDVPSVSEGPSLFRRPQEPAAPVSGRDKRVYFLSHLRLNTLKLTSFSSQGFQLAFTLEFWSVQYTKEVNLLFVPFPKWERKLFLPPFCPSCRRNELTGCRQKEKSVNMFFFIMLTWLSGFIM